MNSSRPAFSSFFLRRVTLTVNVFSSTKLSVCHRRIMRSSRETTLPRFSSSYCKIRSSFFVSGMCSPSYSSTPAFMSSTAPWAVSAGSGLPKS